MDEKLIAKCMLTPDEMLVAEIEGGSEVSGYGTGAAEHRHAENKGISRATVIKAIPIIVEEIPFKRTIIGNECSMPEGTEIWFVTKDELQSLKSMEGK